MILVLPYVLRMLQILKTLFVHVVVFGMIIATTRYLFSIPLFLLYLGTLVILFSLECIHKHTKLYQVLELQDIGLICFGLVCSNMYCNDRWCIQKHVNYNFQHQLSMLSIFYQLILMHLFLSPSFVIFLLRMCNTVNACRWWRRWPVSFRCRCWQKRECTMWN